jgi:uncharacterized protein (TIGR02145 family)
VKKLLLLLPLLAVVNIAQTQVLDVQGNVYNTVRIGKQVWMVENLKTTKYNDGTEIPQVRESELWQELESPSYCWYINNQSTYGDTYGVLYNWFTVNTGQLCPKGWQVPTDEEWTELIDFINSEGTDGGKLKETGTTHWAEPNNGATNETGFTALPGGGRGINGSFNGVGSVGIWWSATEYDPNTAWGRSMFYNIGNVGKSNYGKKNGFSIRCLKD